ncbi:MAG TPA: hypothetical protein VG318_15725 [Actinomycetota bacterium]|nr:hypothetical protein [Actinomycetota bacterium]
MNIHALRRPRVMPLVALGVGAALSLGMMQLGWFGEPRIVEIHTSYGFDLTDAESVFGYAHFVATAEVTEELGKVGDSTHFKVSPVEEMKGELPDSVTVAQIGFELDGDVYQMEDQPLLEVGETYVLALTAPYEDAASEVLTVLGGPVSAAAVDVADEAALEGLRTAAEHRKWPSDLPRQALGEQARRGAEWASQHRGYGMARSHAS